MKYIVVQHYDVLELIEEVNRLIDKGYEPQGGITITTRLNDMISNVVYLQAMVLTKK